MQKKEIRQLTLSQRNALTVQEQNEKSQSITARVLAMAPYANAQNIMIYMSFGSEVQTGSMAQNILQKGKNLIIPWCKQSEIIPCLITDLTSDVDIGRMGILEPTGDNVRQVNPRDIDVIFVPGAGFDQSGNRVGYGKGYYDRFLLRLREGIPVIGLAFECQIVDHIPAEEHDYKMSLLITENRLIYPR